MENVNTFVVVDRFWWGLILISLKNKKKANRFRHACFFLDGKLWLSYFFIALSGKERQ